MPTTRSSSPEKQAWSLWWDESINADGLKEYRLKCDSLQSGTNVCSGCQRNDEDDCHTLYPPTVILSKTDPTIFRWWDCKPCFEKGIVCSYSWTLVEFWEEWEEEGETMLRCRFEYKTMDYDEYIKHLSQRHNCELYPYTQLYTQISKYHRTFINKWTLEQREEMKTRRPARGGNSTLLSYCHGPTIQSEVDDNNERARQDQEEDEEEEDIDDHESNVVNETSPKKRVHQTSSESGSELILRGRSVARKRINKQLMRSSDGESDAKSASFVASSTNNSADDESV